MAQRKRVNGKFVKADSAEALMDDFVKDLEAQQKPAPVKKVKADKPITQAEMAALAKNEAEIDTEGDLLDIWQRRILNPDQRQSTPIRINIPGMHLRWINLSNNGRFQRARYDEGYVPVKKKELVDEHEIYGASFTVEGYVCRGEKQTEMLMRIPAAVYKQIRQRRYDLIKHSNKNIKDQMQQQAAAHFGDRSNSSRGHAVADTLDHFKGEVKFGTESVDPSEEGDFGVVEAGLGGE